MEDQNHEAIQAQLNDIEAVTFGETVEEITSSLIILITLFEFDDNPIIIKACKKRLEEGISLLKKINPSSDQILPEIKPLL